MLDEVASRGFRKIITIEDGVKKGGFGEAVESYFAEHHPEQVSHITVLAIPDEFITHGSVAQLKADCGIDKDALIKSSLQ